MTILDLEKRFNAVQEALTNVNCALKAGSEKVEIERIADEVNALYIKIASMPAASKDLTIVNYTL